LPALELVEACCMRLLSCFWLHYLCICRTTRNCRL